MYRNIHYVYYRHIQLISVVLKNMYNTYYILYTIFTTCIIDVLGAAVAQRLRCCATNRKVAGSISGGVTGIFRLHHPSDRTMALGSTQPLT